MSKPILTPWFQTYQTPARPGYYDTVLPHQYERDAMVLYWDGTGWKASEHSPRDPYNNTFWRTRHWRGLAANPASQQPA
jgi:hypothetical protein